MAQPVSSAEQMISRTTSEGRTELDANELLRSDRVRRTYEAFQKFEELTRQSAVVEELTKLRNLTAELTGSGQYDKLQKQLVSVERLLDDARKANPFTTERERIQAAMDALRGVDKRR
jgi:hypothetical protein